MYVRMYYVCMYYVCMYVCMHARIMYICTYVCVSMYVCVYIYIYIYDTFSIPFRTLQLHYCSLNPPNFTQFCYIYNNIKNPTNSYTFRPLLSPHKEVH